MAGVRTPNAGHVGTDSVWKTMGMGDRQVGRSVRLVSVLKGLLHSVPLAVGLVLAGCVVEDAQAFGLPTLVRPDVPTPAAAASQGQVAPTGTASAVPPTMVPTPTATLEPTETPTATVDVAPVANSQPVREGTPIPQVVSGADPFHLGRLNLADDTSSLTLRYPASFDGPDEVVVASIDILVSDESGRNLRHFTDIGAWLGAHKVFVYPDSLSGRPIVSIHNGYYAGVALQAEPLRALLEGAVSRPYDSATIELNLGRLVGQRFTLEQGGAAEPFEVTQAVRMDARTTRDFMYRPGDLSSLLDPLDDPERSFLILMCSTRQPDEPNETFPARFVLALRLADS